MTLFLADIASYQGSITIEQLRASGMGGINVKVSHGTTQRTVHGGADAYVREARAAQMALCSFHWLTGNVGGVAQADYAYRQMAELGLTVVGCAHVVDVEAGPDSVGGEPTYRTYADYVARMEALLGRGIITYSGRWWWRPRAWAGLTRWLWAAPGAGYLKSYPGDSSPAWDADYGGWSSLAVMQHRVAPIAGMQVSQSAVRDPALWTLMTGGTVAKAWTLIPCLVTLREEFNAVAPGRDKGADGSIGDSAHTSSSDHTPDEISSVLRDHDGDNKNEVHALDIDSDGRWPDGTGRAAGEWFDRKVKALIAEERRRWLDPNDRCRLEYVIWRRTIYSRTRDFAPVAHIGAAHEDHAHFSARYLTETENDTRPWGVKSAPASPAPEQEEDLPVKQADFDKLMSGWASSAAGKKAIATAVLSYDPNQDGAGGVPNPDGAGAAAGNTTVSPATALRDAIVTKTVAYQVRDRVDATNATLDALSAKVDKIATALETDPPPAA